MYVIVTYSKRKNVRRGASDIYIMQHEFIPISVREDNLFTADEAGVAAIMKVVEDNYSYFEKLNHKHRIMDGYSKPALNADWNEYALQRLFHNDLPKYESCVIVYDTEYKDILTLRF